MGLRSAAILGARATGPGDAAMVFARIATLVWLGLVAAVHGAGGSCDRVGGRCQCTDEDGDVWDLTELSGDHQITGPGGSIWTFE